jgi:hypothetical protein
MNNQTIPTIPTKEKTVSDPFAAIRNRANLVQVIDPQTPSQRGKKRHAFSTDYAKACGQKAFLTRKARVQG